MAKSEAEALNYSRVFVTWISTACCDGEDSIDCNGHSADDKLRPQRNCWTDRGLRQLLDIGQEACSYLEKHLLAMKPKLSEIIACLRLNQDSHMNLSCTACAETRKLSQTNMGELQLYALKESTIEPYLVDFHEIPNDVHEMFARARQGTLELKSLQLSSHQENSTVGIKEMKEAIQLDRQPLATLININKELLRSLWTLQTEHRKHIIGVVNYCAQNDNFIVYV